MVLSDRDIKARMKLSDTDEARLLIWPYTEKSPPGTISYGISSGGYDIRIADEYRIFSNMCSGYVDPKKMDPQVFTEYRGPTCLIPPNSFALARSFEKVRIPRDCIGVCLGKSTYARCGIIVTVTPLEPAWEGFITIEISNTSPRPAVIYSNEGIMQVLFHILSSPPETSYADKGGRYQGQTGITLPFVR